MLERTFWCWTERGACNQTIDDDLVRLKSGMLPEWYSLEVDAMVGKEEALEDVRLVVADVDGALVTPDKVLTARAHVGVQKIIGSGIAFTITSGRPPRGMKMLIDDLHLHDPVCSCGPIFPSSAKTCSPTRR
jgi:hypothetical protein